jgi:molecular chaperone GrpE
MEDQKELSITGKFAPGERLANNIEERIESVPGVAPQTAPDPSPSADVAELTAMIQKLQVEKKELYDRLLRKQAELANLRKRTEREKEEFRERANADLIRALLPSLDGLEHALKHRDGRVPSEFYKGLELIHQGLLDVLKHHGVEPIGGMGQIFNPHLHHAVGTVEDAQRHDQEIVEVLLPGYKLKHGVLRPAMVKVAVATKPNDLLPRR